MNNECYGWSCQARHNSLNVEKQALLLVSSQPLEGDKTSHTHFTSPSPPWLYAIASKVTLCHLVLTVTRQRVLLFSPLERDRHLSWTDRRMDGDRERERENVCVEHSILPLEIPPCPLLANVLFFLNTCRRQGWSKLNTTETKDSRMVGNFYFSIAAHGVYKEIVLLLECIPFY